MAKQQTRFSVSICDDSTGNNMLHFEFVPKGSRETVANGKPRQPPAHYSALVQGHGGATRINWINPPKPETTRDELEGIARERVSSRHEWQEKLKKLVAFVKEWAEELGWATKVVHKKVEDAEIGNYSAPALLIQQEAIRLFLEPVARAAPGAQGVVELYLMPSYDDIAGLYYYSGRWNVHYMFEGAPNIERVRRTGAKPLTKAVLSKVLEEMTLHAG